MILAAGLGAASQALAAGLVLPWPADIDPVFALVWIVGAACAVGAAYQAKYHRLASLILMGGAGLATCLTFAWFSAPDLAATQLLVEIVTAVLILFGLRWLPKRMEEIDSAVTLAARLRAGCATSPSRSAAALGLAALSYAVMTCAAPDSDFAVNFLERAYSEGGGTNVVNVILVDFRGFDTLGEIAVLGVAAITVYALLRRFRPARDSVGQPEQQRFQNAYDGERYGQAKEPIDAHYLLVPGLDHARVLPGPGRGGGVLPAARPRPAGRRLRRRADPGDRLHPAIHGRRRALGGGAAAHPAGALDRLRTCCWRLATGLGSLVLGYPFLTSYFAYAAICLRSAACRRPRRCCSTSACSRWCVGATVLMLIALAHQSLRTYRVPDTLRRPRRKPAQVAGRDRPIGRTPPPAAREGA